MKCNHWANQAYEGLSFGKCPKNERLMQMVDLASKPQDWKDLEIFANGCETCSSRLIEKEQENTAILSTVPEPFISASDLQALQLEMDTTIQSVVKMRKLNLGIKNQNKGLISKVMNLFS